MTRKPLKWGIALLLAAVVACVIAMAVLLSRASVETTAHGAPTRLRLHLPGGVGHTVVPRVERMRDGRYAVDVNSGESATEVLVSEDSAPRVVDIAVARNLVGGQPAFRGFSLLDASDRRLLFDMVRDLRRLSALPCPY